MNLWSDLRFAVRLMVRERWLWLAAAVPLALGIAANTTVFTLVNAVLIRGLPFEDADRIVALWMENPEGQEMGLSLPDTRDYRGETSNLAGLGLTLNSTVNVSDDAQAPERVLGSYVSGEFFSMLGVRPVLGRGFTETDAGDGAPPVVLLSSGLWERRYGADPGVLGTIVRVNSLPATVVGVMPAGMQFSNKNEIWIPLGNLPPASDIYNRGIRSFQGIGRLARGASIEQARVELQGVGRRLSEKYPDTNEELRPNLATAPPFASGSDRPIEMDNRESEEGVAAPRTTTVGVSDGYFEALGLEPRMGRTFRPGDGETGRRGRRW